MTLWNILIPSITSRQHKLDALVEYLSPFIDEWNGRNTEQQIQIITYVTESFLDGGPSIGKKRDELVQGSPARYMSFLDDDDIVSPMFIDSCARAMQLDPDVVTFRTLYEGDHYWALVDHDLHYRENEQLNPNYIAHRPPWHVCPTKAAYTKLYAFEDINNAEDWRWYSQVLSHCTTQVKLNQILFKYIHSSKTSEADAIERTHSIA